MADIPALGKDPNEVADRIVKWLPIIGVGGALLWGWGTIVPFLLQAATNSLYLFLEIIAIFVLGVLTLHPQARHNWWLLYSTMMSSIRKMIIHWKPEEILDIRLKNFEKRTAFIGSIVNSLQGAYRQLTDRATQVKRQLSDATAEYQEVQKDSQATEAEKVRSATAMRLLSEELEQNAALQDYNRHLFEPLSKVHEAMDTRIDVIKMEVDSAKRRLDQARLAKQATDQAESALGADSEEQRQYDEAMKFINDQASMQLGRAEDLDRLVRGTISKDRIRGKVAVRQADDLLARLREQADAYLKAPVKTVAESINLSTPAPATAVAGQGSYLNLGTPSR